MTKMKSNIGPFGPLPDSFQSFANLSRTLNEPCTCNYHQPHLYSPGQCRNGHAIIHQHNHDTRGRVPPQFCHLSYEALHLANAAFQYFSKAPKSINQRQQFALQRFAHLPHQTNIFHHLGRPDPSHALPRKRILPLLQIFNDVFFFSALTLDFGWRALPNFILGWCSEQGLIELPPTNPEVEFTTPMTRATRHLETLLHETLHVYLLQFACRQCPTFNVNVHNTEEHGRAFQLLASALEDVVVRLLGWKLHITCMSDFTGSWGAVRHVSSMCDAQR
jgi:hypothetical protein